MATIFKDVVTVNAPDKDIVFDGCDFVDGGRISIEAAKSVIIKNCRFLDSHADGIDVVAETKLMVSYSYFCDNSVISINAAIADGSYISNNYFNGGSECIAIRALTDDTTFTISNNVFKNDANADISVTGAPSTTVKVFGNKFEADYLMSIGSVVETESYNDLKVEFNNNTGKNMIILDAPVIGGEVPDWSDTDNYPAVTINGKEQGHTLPLADGATMIYNNMFMVLDSQGNEIGCYPTLTEAVAAAPSQAEFFLLADAELTETTIIDAGREIQFDLNGYTLTMNKVGARCIFNNGDLMVFNGTMNQVNSGGWGCIDSSKASSASLTLQDVVIIDNGNDDGSSIVDRGNGRLLVSNCKFNSINSGTKGNACCVGNSGARVTIENSIFESATTVGGYPIICRGAEMHVNKCTVHGTKGGIGIDYGKIYIDGCLVTGDNFYGCWVTNDGVSTECHITGNSEVTGKLYAVYCSVDDGNQDMGSANVTIDSGLFVGNTRAAAAIGSKSTVRDWGMTITGGKFLKGDGTPSDVSAYVPAGYIQNESGEVVKTNA